jgi:hypothetical protein
MRLGAIDTNVEIEPGDLTIPSETKYTASPGNGTDLFQLPNRPKKAS